MMFQEERPTVSVAWCCRYKMPMHAEFSAKEQLDVANFVSLLAIVDVSADNLLLGGLHHVRDRPPALHCLLQSDPHLSSDG